MHLTVSASEGYQVACTMRFIMLHKLLPASPCVKAATTDKENDQKDYQKSGDAHVFLSATLRTRAARGGSTSQETVQCAEEVSSADKIGSAQELFG